MSIIKKIVIGLVSLACLFVMFTVWYQFTYSMDVAKSFESGTLNSQQRILIATQGSDYKDAVVQVLVANLADQPDFVSVIDVSGLNAIDATDWQAIVLLHTWERFQPPAVVKAFLDRTPERHNIIALTTSGSGSEKLPGVDAIASASNMNDVAKHQVLLTNRVKALLAMQENTQ